jgi:purine-binding chemotaxis protein CheW
VDALFQLVVFTLHEQLYALRLAAVDRIVRVAEITALPSAPDIVQGVVNIEGRIVPVISLRRRFGLPDRDLALSDHLIFARTARRAVALLVASVVGVIECSPSQVTASADSDHVEGVLKLDDGLVLIHDLDTFLSPMEDRKLTHALTAR